MLTVRHPAVAGRFYPGQPADLRVSVRRFVEMGQHQHPPLASRLKAIIVPHAGYDFSGPVAGTAYAQLSRIADSVTRVILLGPAHFVRFAGMAVSDADLFETPLGEVSVDSESVQRLLQLPQVCSLDEAHACEHSLEVQLPFLQETLGTDYALTPVAVGKASVEEVVEALEEVWGGPETVLVVSSDLSHYHDHATATRIDRETTSLIERLRWEELNGKRACGYAVLRGLLEIAKRRGLKVTTLDVRNSGDTAGPRDHVVGYGAYAIHS